VVRWKYPCSAKLGKRTVTMATGTLQGHVGDHERSMIGARGRLRALRSSAMAGAAITASVLADAFAAPWVYRGGTHRPTSFRRRQRKLIDPLMPTAYETQQHNWLPLIGSGHASTPQRAKRVVPLGRFRTLQLTPATPFHWAVLSASRRSVFCLHGSFG
jgi:hypothetical protein